MPLHHPKNNQRKEKKINIKSEKLNKRKEKLSVSKTFHNTLESACQTISNNIQYIPKQ